MKKESSHKSREVPFLKRASNISKTIQYHLGQEMKISPYLRIALLPHHYQCHHPPIQQLQSA